MTPGGPMHAAVASSTTAVKTIRLLMCPPLFQTTAQPASIPSLPNFTVPMRRPTVHFSVAVAATLLGQSVSAQTRQPADLVITGATIYTVDANHPRVEAVAVRGGKIVFAGDLRGVRA